MDARFYEAVETIIKANAEYEAINLLLESKNRKYEDMRNSYREFQAEKKAIVSILKYGDSSYKSKVQATINFFSEQECQMCPDTCPLEKEKEKRNEIG